MKKLNYRQRHRLVAWVLAGVAVMATVALVHGYYQAQDPLGPVSKLTDDLAGQTTTDGRYLVYHEFGSLEGAASGVRVNRIVILDLDEGSRRVLEGDALQDWNAVPFALIYEVAAHGTLFTRAGLLDLDRGTFDPAPWPSTFHPTATDGEWVFGYEQHTYRPLAYDLERGLVAIEWPESALDVRCQPTVMRASTTHVLFDSFCPPGSTETQYAVANRSDLTKVTVLQPTVDTVDADPLDLAGDAVLATGRDAHGRLALQIRDADTLAVVREFPLDLPAGAQVQRVRVWEERWIVQFAGPDPSLGGSGFVYGRLEAGVDGVHAADFSFEPFSRVIPLPGRVIFEDAGAIWIAEPGGVIVPPLVSMVVAGVAIVAAVTWPAASWWWLRRRAGDGMRRCLHCGRKRTPGVTFCPDCGWRTATEDAAANPKKELFDYD